MLFKYAIIGGIIVYFIVGLLSVGTRLRKKIFGNYSRNIEQIFLNIGLGLLAFCLVNYALILFNLFYGIIIALLFIGLGVCSWFMRKQTAGAVSSLEEIMHHMGWSRVKHSPRMMIFVLLLLFSFVYLHYGFVLSDIPYPTAWDANHAYMYFPKIWASHSGFYREESIMTTPNMWLAYITFWFKFVYIFGKNTWISADNLAVLMNFLSGIFTLTFGVVLVKEVITFIHGKNEHKADDIFLAI